MHHRLFKLRLWFEDRFPTARQRLFALAAAPLMLVCLVWIIFFAATSTSGGTGTVRVSAAVRHAAELTDTLHRDPAFTGVTVRQHVDYPDRFRVEGQVGRAADLELLKMRLAEIDPDQPFVIEVRVPR